MVTGVQPIADVYAKLDQLRRNLGQVIRGKSESIEILTIALLSARCTAGPETP